MGRRRLHTAEHCVEVMARLFAKGRPPTVEEFRVGLGVGSSRTALRYLAQLEREGYIVRWPGARGIQFLAPYDAGPTLDRLAEAIRVRMAELESTVDGLRFEVGMAFAAIRAARDANREKKR